MTKQSEAKLPQFVYVVKNALSHDLCSEIIDEYKDDERFDWAEVSASDGSGVVDKEHRLVRKLEMSNPASWNYNTKRISLLTSIQKAAQDALHVYYDYLLSEELVSSVPGIKHDEGFNLLHYKEGYMFNEHVDELHNVGRVFSCSIALNEDFSGGEFQFFRGSVTHDLSAGDIILFPSSFLFPHAITPVTSGERYSIITWLH